MMDILIPPVVRFGLVTVLGLGIDVSLAWGLATLAGLPLPLAALCGFLVAAGINYVLHEFWTFSSGTRSVSAKRGLAYLLGLGLTLATRLAAVTGLSSFVFTDPSARLPVLIMAVACSFVVNYLFSKYVVFRARPAVGVLPVPGAEGCPK